MKKISEFNLFVLCPTFHGVKNQVIRRCRSESMPITVRHVTREQAANNQPANHPTLQSYSSSKHYITTQRYTTIQNYTTTQLYTTTKLYTTTQLYTTFRNCQAVRPAFFCRCLFVVVVLCFVVAGVPPLLFCSGCIVIAKIWQKTSRIYILSYPSTSHVLKWLWDMQDAKPMFGVL